MQMADLAGSLNHTIATLTVTTEEVRLIADRFRRAMVSGLAGMPSSLKMLPSHLAKPDGSEQGLYLALDFGGTNVRVVLVELLGSGKWIIRHKQSAALKDPQGGYDYTAGATTTAELFDFLAEQIAAVVDKDRDYFLGYTFSFPCHQQRVEQAVLIEWTKEIETTGVKGREVGQLLTEALLRRGLHRVKTAAIINDTVGTLLAASFSDQCADIGAICGTGHNTCYYDPVRSMIINMESGNFDNLSVTEYDEKLDAASGKYGSQRLEKMVAGRYLGELVRLIAADYIGLSLAANNLTAEDLAGVIGGNVPGGHEIAELNAKDLSCLKDIAQAVVNRSARLAAATFLGVLDCVDPKLKCRHTIAVDGSLYEKMPGYAEAVTTTIKDVLGANADMVSVRLVKDGSGVGAAIAAAVATRTSG
jgi:hexokinase